MIKFRFLTYSNFGLFENWYKEMSKKGYEIKRQKFSFIHFFEKTEPKEVDYKFSILQNESKFTALSKEELKEFDKLSKNSGWNLIYRSFNMNLYKLEEEYENSLYNDETEEMCILSEGVKNEIISLSILFVVIALLNFFMLGNFISTALFYSNFTIFAFPAFVLLGIFNILGLIDYLIFKRKNRKANKISDIKFSKLSYSKAYINLLITVLILVTISIIFQIIELIPLLGGKVLLGWLPNVLAIFLIFLFRKKIKTSVYKTKTKKKIFTIIMVIVLTFSFILTGVFFTSMDNRQINSQYINGYKVMELGKSILLSNHRLYSQENSQENLEKVIEISVCKSEYLAQKLFSRHIKNAKNHPYQRDFVEDVSGQFYFDKTFKTSSEDDFIILQGNVVLNVTGDINSEEVLRDLRFFMENING
ncbi:MAG: DUF2812 domain-containing protein [Lagierella massiliensis]|nr:DUF2812 domain-containing protein [Lagierella massiliensis]